MTPRKHSIQNPDSTISNSKHPLLAQLNDLATAVGRQARSQFLVEGLLLVQRALEDHLPIDWIAYTSDLQRTDEGAALPARAAEAGVPCMAVSAGLLGKVTSSRPVPEVVAPVSFSAAAPGNAKLVLIAENINNPDNLGMILRTADAAGVDCVVTAGCDPYHKNCVRAARGGVGRLPILTTNDLPAYLRSLKVRGIFVAGTALDGATDLYATELQLPIAVIVGNENSGITREALAECTHTVRIPMAAGQNSLNVGVAAGVVLYEVRRQSVAADADHLLSRKQSSVANANR